MPSEIQRWLTQEFEQKGFNVKLMAFNYAKYNTQSSGSGDKSPLPEGAYTSNPKAKNKSGDGLHIIKLLAPKTLGSGATRHSFLVGSHDVNGTGFLKIDLHNYYLTPEACALAFGKKDKDGPVFQVEPDDELNAAVLEATQAAIQAEADAKVAAANTPDEAVHDATEETIHKILLQIQINVGTIFRLQDWAGIERNPQSDLGSLEGTEFEGSVKASNLPGGAPEISVFSKPVPKANGKAH